MVWTTTVLFLDFPDIFLSHHIHTCCGPTKLPHIYVFTLYFTRYWILGDQDD
jgi:hypothetical protein